MKKLIETKKITLATVKSFIKRNEGNLYVKVCSRFSGMTDMVEDVKDDFEPAQKTESNNNYNLGFDGIWCVGSSRDRFTLYRDKDYVGVNIYNCTGKCIIAAKKQQQNG